MKEILARDALPKADITPGHTENFFRGWVRPNSVGVVHAVLMVKKIFNKARSATPAS